MITDYKVELDQTPKPDLFQHIQCQVQIPQYYFLPGNIETIQPFVEHFELDDFFEMKEEFFHSLEEIKSLTTKYEFDDIDFFLSRDLFPKLFFLAFPDPENGLDFFQSRALRILKNFINFTNPKYHQVLIGMEIIEKSVMALNSNSDKVINCALKLLISICSIDISYAQDTLVFINLKNVLEIDSRTWDDSTMRYIDTLIYLLSRCDTQDTIHYFYKYLRHRISEILSQIEVLDNHPEYSDSIMAKLFLVFSITQNLVKSTQIADDFLRDESFLKILQYSLNHFTVQKKEGDDYLFYQFLSTMHVLHHYFNYIIEDFDYVKFIEFILIDDQMLSELVTTIFIDILASENNSSYFILHTNAIETLIMAQTNPNSSYNTKINSVEAIANAILTMTPECFPIMIKSGTIPVIVESVLSADGKLLKKLFRSLDRLFSIDIQDEEGNNLVLAEFEQCDLQSLYELFVSDTTTSELASEFIFQHPDLFQSITRS